MTNHSACPQAAHMFEGVTPGASEGRHPRLAVCSASRPGARDKQQVHPNVTSCLKRSLKKTTTAQPFVLISKSCLDADSRERHGARQYDVSGNETTSKGQRDIRTWAAPGQRAANTVQDDMKAT